MKSIKEAYKITNNTIAILPAKQIEFDSYVFELNRKICVKKTPLQLIKEACIDYWSTFYGRRDVVMKRMGYKQKVPIPISTKYGIVAFPTHNINSFECAWLFTEHIRKIQQHPNHPDRSLVIFTNRKTLPFDVSLHILQSQYKRSLKLKYAIMEGKIY